MIEEAFSEWPDTLEEALAADFQKIGTGIDNLDDYSDFVDSLWEELEFGKGADG
jgi:hypothetical protein